jgi:hypothetical protein
LNHVPGGTINPVRPVEADANTLFYFRFRGTADMAGLAAGLVPVANDPNSDTRRFFQTR